MALLLGLDTGGTYTDAALLDDASTPPRVIAKAKALTTRHDLAIGLGEAARAAIEASGRGPQEIGLVSLSTTLATNALVEGQGGRVALVAIGFAPGDLERAGLKEALGGDPVITLSGGHTTHGQEAAPLDLKPLESAIADTLSDVSGFAVAGYFAVRNPAHEVAVRDFLRERLSAAVTCSHELSAQLNGPKRALTTVLNARLVPLITRLVEATKETLHDLNIDAPITVVRGDGALVSADFAAQRPIETILSGPAASLVGARFLTGEEDAFVCDIGGTTSDVALLEGGRPKLDPAGATVGGFRTMVRAVAMHTFGLGGDSEVGLGGPALEPELTLGPRRLIPVSLLAKQHGAVVHAALDRQLKSILNNRHDARFALRSRIGSEAGLPASQARVFAKIGDEPTALDTLLQGNAEAAALDALVDRGLVLVSGLTPSDAIHALGDHDAWDAEAARKALALFARRRDGAGQALAADPLDLARRIVARVERRTADVVLQTAWHIDGKEGDQLVTHPLVSDALSARHGNHKEAAHVAVDIALKAPLIGLGASAFRYHPEAGRMLATRTIVPEHAEVANAIGAVVGQIAMRHEVVVTQPRDGQFSVTGMDQPFANEAEALSAAEGEAVRHARQLAEEAGARDIVLHTARTEKRADIEGRPTLVEATIVATATGRPPVAE